MTEEAAIKAGLATAATTIIGTAELSSVSSIELGIVLWLVGGLLAVIATLLAAICYFIKGMKDDNKTQHDELFDANRGVLDRLSHLEGEHSSAFQLRGCAFESENLKEKIKEVLDARDKQK